MSEETTVNETPDTYTLTRTPLVYEPMAGEHIDSACEFAVRLVRRHGVPVRFRFNGIDVETHAGETAETVAARWHAASDAAREAYRLSPAGQAAAAEAAAHLRYCQQRTDALIARLPGVVRDKRALLRWCMELADSVIIGVVWDRDAILRCLAEAGWKANDALGLNDADYAAEHGTAARYLFGQAMDCIAHGLPPHHMIGEFARRWNLIGARP